MRRLQWVSLIVALIAAPVSAQSVDTTRSAALPETQRLRFYVDVLAAAYQDYSQSPLGHESQGRIGWVILGLTGTLNDHVSFLAEINPANDSAVARPACGEAHYFYPNVPEPEGPVIRCVPEGRDRVDLYRFVGLDPLSQQGAIRRAIIDVHTTNGDAGFYAGRFIVPTGFQWHELGSLTNQDAPLIQRLNADANFGAGVYGVVRRAGRQWLRADIAAFRGDARRGFEYAYQGFGLQDEDTNSDFTAAGRLTMKPVPALDLRVSGRYGFSGSKVEDYRTFHLSKRRDHAVVASAQYRLRPSLRVFGEHATYWSGLPGTSARHLGLEPDGVLKPGYYAGGEATFSIPYARKGGVVLTYEDLSRNDSLVWLLASQPLMRVHLGARVRSAAIRMFVRPTNGLDFVVYWNHIRNPFPWLSGIVPIAGPSAFLSRPEGSRKFGMVLRLRIP